MVIHEIHRLTPLVDINRIKWRSNVESLDCNFGKHIARFVGPQQFVTNAYTAPILFVGGSKSDYLTLVPFSTFMKFSQFPQNFTNFQTIIHDCCRGPNELEKIQAIFPQANLQFLDTGHLVQVEAPNEFIDLTVDFINAK